MNTDQIRASITLAIENEKLSHDLEKLLCLQIDKLHSAIRLPSGDGIEILLQFVIHYIQHVPDMIDATESVTSEAGIGDYAQPFLSLATEYFLQPPEMLSNHSGLVELMDQAYLAHRLIEEVNDRYIPKTGIPIIPLDMTSSNLIIHNIIGEPYANELDDAVHFTAECLMNKEKEFQSEKFKAYVAQHKQKGWADIEARWPCLTDDLAIHLALSKIG